MIESNDPVIHAAVHSLQGDMETQLSARTLLESLREREPRQEEEALIKWKAQESKRPRDSWLWKFAFIFVTAFILITAVAALDLWSYLKIYRMLYLYEEAFPADMIDHTGLTAHQRRLLTLGDSDSARTEIAKAIWDSAPENPAYFWEYSQAHFSEMTRLPTDFLVHAHRIDPDNAFFPYLAAAAEAKDSVKKQSLSWAATKSGAKPGWNIVDENRLNRSLEILYKHQRLKDCRSYELDMIRERIPLLAQNNYMEYYQSVGFLGRSSYFVPPYRDLSNGLAAKAWSLGEAGDIDGFMALKKNADLYLRNIARYQSGNLVHEIIIEVSAKTILENLTSSATKLGLTTEAAQTQLQLDRLVKLKDDRQASAYQIEGQDAERKVGLLNSVSMIARRALHPPILREKDVRPGRVATHLLLAQICTYGVLSTLSVIAGVTALYRFRSPRVIRQLSKQIKLLLRPVDWAWLFLAAAPPFIYLSLILQLTPLGGYELSLTGVMVKLPYDGELPLPVIQFTGMLLMLLILMVLVARWRFSKRVAFFGFGNPRYGLGTMAALSAAAFIPLIGWAVTHGSSHGLVASWVVFGIPVAWILSLAIRAMTTGAGQLLQLTTCSRVLVPTYLAAVLILLLASLFFKPMRQYWFERDPMARLDVAHPSLTKFEYEVAVAARKELREALGYD